MYVLAHGTGGDDIAVMVIVIGIGMYLLRRSEKSVRARAAAEDAENAAAGQAAPNQACRDSTDAGPEGGGST